LPDSTSRPLPIAAKLLTALHRGLYQLSGSRIGGRFGKMPILLLTTKGRRSGLARTNPLTYLPDGEDDVLIAANGGKGYPPAWFGNLVAHPEGVAQIGSQRFRVNARVAGPEQCDRL
jgi:deazaflavin-dependent oxidoreductase (nitroreductase family)